MLESLAVKPDMIGVAGLKLVTYGARYGPMFLKLGQA